MIAPTCKHHTKFAELMTGLCTECFEIERKKRLDEAFEKTLVQDPEDIKAHDSMNKTLGADEQDDRHGVYNPEAEFEAKRDQEETARHRTPRAQ